MCNTLSSAFDFQSCKHALLAGADSWFVGISLMFNLPVLGTSDYVTST